MPTTTIQPLPYPAPGDSPDVPRDIKVLAEAVEDRTVMRFQSVAARDAALPSGTLRDGMLCYIEADGLYRVRIGGAWAVARGITQTVQHGRASLNISGLAAGSAGANAPVNFPAAFAGTPRVIVQHTSLNRELTFSTWGISTTGFSITPLNAGSAAIPASTTVDVDWIAVYG